MQSRGFSVEVLPLHPFPDHSRLPDTDDPAARAVKERFFGSQDYAVFALKS
jgi:hypothetical protein